MPVRPADTSRETIANAVLLSRSDAASQAGLPGDRFEPKIFRNIYYDKYFFLFRKNLTNSDIPFGELRSLLQIHITDQAGGRLPLQFDTSKHITDALSKIWTALPGDGSGSFDSRARLLTETFADFIAYSIGVDALYGSCVVHVPRSVGIHLERIVAESGYVYAAGHAIFVRRTQKATKALFRNNLLRYLKGAEIKPERKIAFLIHSPQLFPIGEYNREVASQLRHGLDDVKISLDKFFFEDMPLYDFRTQLRDDPELSKYLKFVDIEHSRYDPTATGTDPSRSIWLIAEQEIGQLDIRRAPERYFACYVQEHVNRNQLHLFNERKPGWISPITLPQTLAAAMINLARPYLRKPQTDGDRLTILDPFAGTGTVVMEALKLRLPATYYVNDLNAFNAIVLADNLRFFSRSRTELEDLRRKVEAIKQYLKSGTAKTLFHTPLAARALPPGQPETLLNDAIAHYRIELQQYQQTQHSLTDHAVPRFSYARGINSHTFSQALEHRFSQWTFEQHIIFYITWRALIRNTFAFVNEEDNAKVAQQTLGEEFGLFEYELRTLIRDCYDTPDGKEQGGCVRAGGRYSKSAIVHPSTFAQALNGVEFADNVKWTSTDASVLLTEFLSDGKQFDLIITDPPYGINALDGQASAVALVRLYSTFLSLAVRLLRDGGQLLLCVPENTHNGQSIPAYMTRDIVVREILINAAKVGMEMVNPSFDSPSPYHIFRPPFYWESERTLRRAILHFIIRRSYTFDTQRV